MDEINSNETSHKGEKRRNFSLLFKAVAVEFAKTNSIRSAAEKYNVDRKRIREWSQKAELIAENNAKRGCSKRQRLDGGGRKLTDDDLEHELTEWIYSRRENMLRVSRKLIMTKAKSIYDEHHTDPASRTAFVASRGWLEKFMKRNGLSLRRKTTVAQKDPSQMVNKIISYLLRIRRLTRQFSYDPGCIIAMDETAVWSDMISETTVDRIGLKDIPLKTSGHEKVRVTVCLAAKSDGTKLKPFIVFGGAKRESKTLNDEFKNCIVTSSSNAWMNEALTIQWVEEVIGKFSFQRRLLAWDSFQCHVTANVRSALKKINTDSVVIPGGCTKYIQAPDVSWNKPFKSIITERYDEWMSNGIHEYTNAGNLKAPPRRQIVEWIIQSWNDLPKALIAKSFKCCGLNLPNDGSQDEVIHCFKKGNPCEAGAALLKAQLDVLEDSLLNQNPFDEITESDMEDANEPFRLLDQDSDDDIIDIE